jgi:hypothetical protein
VRTTSRRKAIHDLLTGKDVDQKLKRWPPKAQSPVFYAKQMLLQRRCAATELTKEKKVMITAHTE